MRSRSSFRWRTRGTARARWGVSPVGARLGLTAALGLFACAACDGRASVAAGDSGALPAGDGPAVKVRTPRLTSYAPGALSVGQRVTLLGADFILSSEGKVTLTFTGTYTDAAGKSHPVKHQAAATLVSSGKLTWRLYPNIVFHPKGDVTGRFVGSVTATNRTGAGEEAVSVPLKVVLSVQPSLIVRESRADGTACALVGSATLADHAYTVGIEAVGFQPGSAAVPLSGVWSLSGDQWQVSLLVWRPRCSFSRRKKGAKHGSETSPAIVPAPMVTRC